MQDPEITWDEWLFLLDQKISNHNKDQQRGSDMDEINLPSYAFLRSCLSTLSEVFPSGVPKPMIDYVVGPEGPGVVLEFESNSKRETEEIACLIGIQYLDGIVILEICCDYFSAKTIGTDKLFHDIIRFDLSNVQEATQRIRKAFRYYINETI